MEFKSERTSSQVFAILITIALSALLASGCSTPPVSGNTVDNNTTSSSYSNCVRLLTAQGVQYQCNMISTPNTTSYNRYTFTTSGLTGKVGTAEMETAYKAYLAGLDEASAESLKAQWDALAAASH